MKTTLLTLLLTFFISTNVFSQTPFGQEQTIDGSTGDNPYVIASGDLDGDTFIDIVIGTYDFFIPLSGDDIFWYKNDGSGNFTIQSVVDASFDFIGGLAIADLDGLNGNDIIAASATSNEVVWYANDGSGGFGAKQVISNPTPLNGAGQVVIVDIDNDGNLDVAAVGYTADKVVWYKGNGAGNFGSEQIIESGTNGPGAISFADFDGDTDLDIVIGYTDAGTIEVYYNQFFDSGTVSWVKETNTINSGNGYLFVVAFADVNDDGQLDIIKSDNSSNPFGEIAWYNKEAGDIVAARGLVTCANAVATDNVTVNGLVYTAVNGVKADNTEFSVDTSDTATATDLADSITNDVRVGITVPAVDQTATSNLGVVTITASTPGPIGNTIDLASNNGTRLTVSRAFLSGGGSYTETAITNSIARPAVVMAKDINDDTFTDIIISNGGTNGDDIIWFESNGAGTYLPEAMISDAQAQVYGVTVNDFNEDTKLDIASLDWQGFDLNWFENDPPIAGINDNTIQKISIYPNPTSDKLYFKSSLTESFKVSVFDILGKNIINTTIQNGNALDVSKLHAGIYIIRFDEYSTTYKFVKE